MTPVLHTAAGYDVMVPGLICSHGRVQYGCCVAVATFSWPWMSVDRLRDTVSVRCLLCVHGDGVQADACGVLMCRMTGTQVCSVALWMFGCSLVGL